MRTIPARRMGKKSTKRVPQTRRTPIQKAIDTLNDKVCHHVFDVQNAATYEGGDGI